VSEESADLDAQRARVAELEAELAAQSRRTNNLLAQAQDRTYWLDRWQLDLNAIMRTPLATGTRNVLRRGRGMYRSGKRLARAARSR
jgi:hypothetical protein